MKYFIFLFLILSPNIVLGSNWYILNANTKKCINATSFSADKNLPEFESPLNLVAFAQHVNKFNGISVIQFKNGSLMSKVGFDNRYIMFFNSKYSCKVGSKVLTRMQREK